MLIEIASCVRDLRVRLTARGTQCDLVLPRGQPQRRPDGGAPKPRSVHHTDRYVAISASSRSIAGVKAVSPAHTIVANQPCRPSTGSARRFGPACAIACSFTSQWRDPELQRRLAHDPHGVVEPLDAAQIVPQ